MESKQELKKELRKFADSLISGFEDGTTLIEVLHDDSAIDDYLEFDCDNPQPKKYPCPFKDIDCDKINTVTMSSVLSCTKCEHYNKGVIFKKPKECVKVLSIGFITPDIEAYKRFKEANFIHGVFMIDNSCAVRGLHFDVIIKGNDWHLIDESIVNSFIKK